MLKKTIKFEGFDGPATEDLYFNLTKIEMIDLSELMKEKYMIDVEAGEAAVQAAFEVMEPRQRLEWIKDVAKASFGVRDGNRFRKDADSKQYFEESLAVAEFFEQMVLEPQKLADFLKAIIPQQ